MNYNVLVTGGAGYLGSIMVSDLLQAGHKVTVQLYIRPKQLGARLQQPELQRRSERIGL